MSENILFGNYSSESFDGVAQFVKSRFLFYIFLGLADIDNGIVFNLADSFASDFIFLADSFQSHSLGVGPKTETTANDILGSGRKDGKETFGNLLWLKCDWCFICHMNYM